MGVMAESFNWGLTGCSLLLIWASGNGKLENDIHADQKVLSALNTVAYEYSRLPSLPALYVGHL